MLDAQPATVYLASLDAPLHDSEFGFWSEHHRIHFLTIVLSTNVAVGMKFDPTCPLGSVPDLKLCACLLNLLYSHSAKRCVER